ncbi:FYN-binding protein 1 isoform X2 [Danio aesculapii]|uniref:FYN-binding protein 1 isoform X2 n=1 Tax=Danio aesculapii TaxID=1142201 RepID=UPI0024C007A8|nr:FYN-binding protein 1 isoform X2 [Danio aesculapii]
MDNKSDVKAIMARFQAGGASVEGAPSVRPKPPVQPTLSSGPVVPSKKPVLETSLSGGATSTSTPPKPNFLKNTVNTARSAPDMHDPPKPKAFVNKFENMSENKDNFKVHVKPKPPDSSLDSEPSKVPFPKVPLQKPSSSIMANDLKDTSPKPLVSTTKPSWVKEIPKAEENNPITPKLPSAPKPKSTMAMMRQQPEENSNRESTVRPSPVSNVKPSSFRVKNTLTKLEEGVKDGAKASSTNESVSKPVAPIKPNFPKKAHGPSAQTVNDDPSAPKKKTLPNTYALGSAPSKPNRPPKVNLEKFKKASEVPTDSPGPKNVTPPPPPAAHPSIQAPPALPSQPLPPCLPPRHPGPLIQDENYDDVECLRPQTNEGSGSDGEIYEDLDDSRSSAAEPSQPQKKPEKDVKNQKDREKKEKDAIKKFKISAPFQVMHQVKAKSDCKGGKNDLSIKKGESIDIIRITDNPEGKWLGRNQDGSFGYVKTEMVQINFSALKNQAQSPQGLENEEVYDDVESVDDQRNMNGQRVVLPPPPEDDDVYDDIPDSNPISTGDPRPLLKRSFLDMLKVSVERRKSQLNNNDIPPPPQFTPEVNKDIPQDIYDDVDSFPPAPPPSSLPQIKSKQSKVPDDPKKQKKFEKEEKEFRKKFKYDGEIQVLHQATIATSKKGSGKDLAVQAGETVDVISKSDPDKFICRNKEGKFGYVSLSNIHTDDEVYDDIGDDCIYDND